MEISRKSKVISCILKGVVIVSAAVGVWLSAAAGRQGFMGGTRVFMYFTIQSNIAIAVICAVGGILMIRSFRIRDWWLIVKFVGTISITLTGAVFCFVLAPVFGPMAWNLQNVLTHVVVPITAVIGLLTVLVVGQPQGIGADFPDQIKVPVKLF